MIKIYCNLHDDDDDDSDDENDNIENEYSICT